MPTFFGRPGRRVFAALAYGGPVILL